MALVFKVGTLFIKTASKPLANRFQKWVLGHPVGRQRVIALAQVGCSRKLILRGMQCMASALKALCISSRHLKRLRHQRHVGTTASDAWLVLLSISC